MTAVQSVLYHCLLTRPQVMCYQLWSSSQSLLLITEWLIDRQNDAIEKKSHVSEYNLPLAFKEYLLPISLACIWKSLISSKLWHHTPKHWAWRGRPSGEMSLLLNKTHYTQWQNVARTIVTAWIDNFTLSLKVNSWQTLVLNCTVCNRRKHA